MRNAGLVPVLTASMVSFLGTVLASIAGPWGAVVAGLVAGVILGWLLRVWDPAFRSWWAPPLSVSAAAGVGAAITLSATAPSSLWAAIVAAGLCYVPLAVALWLHGKTVATPRNSSVCIHCRQGLTTGSGLECPRCGMTVCESPECWSYEGCRCRRCESTGVAVLPQDPRWWESALGPRHSKGQCQLCLTVAGETDLRACRQCGHKQCRPCWDHSNGQCRYCNWVVPELPRRLARYMQPGAPQHG